MRATATTAAGPRSPAAAAAANASTPWTRKPSERPRARHQHALLGRQAGEADAGRGAARRSEPCSLIGLRRFFLYGRRTALRGPARKPASTSSGMISVSTTGWPSNRSTASRLRATGRGRAARAPRSPAAATPRRARGAARASGRRARRTAPPRRRAGRPARRRRGRRAHLPASATGAPPRTAAPGSAAASTSGSGSSSSSARSSRSRSTAPGERELRAAEALDEVAAPAGADRLEILQLAVDGAVAARDALGAHAVARDDPLPLEQQLRERAPVGAAGEEPVGRATSCPAST